MIRIQSTTPKNSTKKIQDLPQPNLGNGFSTDKQMAAQLQCFAPGRIRYAGSSSVSTTFSNSISFSQAQSILNVDVSSSLSVGMFSAGISADYARYIEQTRYSQALYYLANVTLPTQIFQPIGSGTSVLTSIGQDIYDTGPEQFRDVCGDKLITMAIMGGLLLVTMIIKFESNYDSTTFSAHVSLDWGDIFSATAKIKQVVTQYSLKGFVEFTALQSAGDPTQLAKIFGNCANHYCITTCSLEDMGACAGVITGVVHYAQKEFVPQVMANNGTEAAQLFYGMINVTELGLQVGPSVLNSTIIEARQTLGHIYQSMSTNSTFVKHLLNSPYKQYMFTATQNSLQANDNALDANLALLNDQATGAVDCYYHPTNCPATAAALLPQLQKVDTTFLNGMNRGFIMYAHGTICEGGATDVGALLFPADSTSNIYLITSNINLQPYLTATNTTLTITGDGIQCPIGHILSDHTTYKFDNFPSCQYGNCVGAECITTLSGSSSAWYCGSPAYAAEMDITLTHNPL